MRRDARANARAARRGVRTGHEWIRPKIDVEQRALCPLEEDVSAVAYRPIQQDHRVRDERAQFAPARQVLIVDLRKAQRLRGLPRRSASARRRAERLEDLVVFPNLSTQFLGETFRRKQIDEPQTRARDLVGVGGADAAFRGADLAPALLFLADFVEQLVVREHEMRGLADIQVTVDGHAASTQVLNFGKQRHRIDYHAVADHADLARMQDARRDQVQDILLVANLNRVTRVVAALIAHHHVGLFGQHVDDLALALVAPLRAH